MIVLRTVRVYKAVGRRQSHGARERHLRMLCQSQERASHVVCRRDGGGPRSQVSDTGRRVHAPAGHQCGQTGGRGRGQGRVPGSDLHRKTHRTT